MTPVPGIDDEDEDCIVIGGGISPLAAAPVLSAEDAVTDAGDGLVSGAKLAGLVGFNLRKAASAAASRGVEGRSLPFTAAASVGRLVCEATGAVVVGVGVRLLVAAEGTGV